MYIPIAVQRYTCKQNGLKGPRSKASGKQTAPREGVRIFPVTRYDVLQEHILQPYIYIYRKREIWRDCIQCTRINNCVSLSSARRPPRTRYIVSPSRFLSYFARSLRIRLSPSSFPPAHVYTTRIVVPTCICYIQGALGINDQTLARNSCSQN